MSASLQLTASIEDFEAIALQGVRRALIFSGIGINAAELDPPLSHLLTKGLVFHVIPDDLPSEVQRRHAKDFEKWIIAGAFREVVEAFSNYLNECFAAIYLINTDAATVPDMNRELAKIF